MFSDRVGKHIEKGKTPSSSPNKIFENSVKR